MSIDKEKIKIKETIKDSITSYNQFIMDIYDDIIDFINKCMKYEIDKYVDNELLALEEIVVFILDILTEKYETENLNENNLYKLLISYIFD